MISNCFDELLKTIEPDAEKKGVAAEIPGIVRDHIKDSEDLSTEFPHTRLAGSYARSTAICDIKDVDILVYVNRESSVQLTISQVLNHLKGALKNIPKNLTLGAEPEIRPQRRSVHLALPYYEIELDMVPIRMTTDEPDDVLEVPDRKLGKWIKTDPIGYAHELTRINKSHEGKAVKLVKLFKYWRDVNFPTKPSRPKSYWLEVLVFNLIDGGTIETKGNGLAQLIMDIFQATSEQFGPVLERQGAVPRIRDPRLGHNVADGWEREHFERFMKRLEESLKHAKRAIELANSGEESKSVEEWQKVFGVEFPTIESVAGSYAAAAVAGGLGLENSGIVSVRENGMHIPAATRRIPPTKFYGEK